MAWSTYSSGLRICSGTPVAQLSRLSRSGASTPWRRLGWRGLGPGGGKRFAASTKLSSSPSLAAFLSSDAAFSVKPSRNSKIATAAADADSAGAPSVESRGSDSTKLVRRGKRGGVQSGDSQGKAVGESVGETECGVGSSVIRVGLLHQTLSSGRLGVRSRARKGLGIGSEGQLKEIDPGSRRDSRADGVDSSLTRVAKVKLQDSGNSKAGAASADRKSQKRAARETDSPASTIKISKRRSQAGPDALKNLERRAMASSDTDSQQNGNHSEAKAKPLVRQQGETQQRSKKKKEFTPEAMLRRDLNMCSKDGDVVRALEIYDKSVAEGTVKWNQYNFNILLYLCSSAALGTLTARKNGADLAEAERLNQQSSQKNENGMGSVESVESVERAQVEPGNNSGSGDGKLIAVEVSSEVMELCARRGFEIFENMKRLNIPPNEATLTAVARLAVAREDGDLAFQMVKEMAEMKIAPRLRSYSPAIITFCKARDSKKAFEVDAHMVAAGVQPEEPELAALLELCVGLGLENEVYSVIHRLRTRLRALAPSTASFIEQWFSGEKGTDAGKDGDQPDSAAVYRAVQAGGGGWHGLGWLGAGKWKPSWSSIDEDGFCCSCGKQLLTIDLDPEETDNFAKSVSALAFQRETKPNHFKMFQEWLERHGPFEAIIDGANVGLYNQNFPQGGFNFYQLNAVANTALDLGLVTKPPLIILHHARTRFGAANTRLGQELLQKWTASHTLYSTPNGSNDDWYWLYAAVKNKCLLITNDEMRDHLFQLLGSGFFPKWKERHQVRLAATNNGLQFRLPPPYSVVIQESEDGSWHFPKSASNNSDASYEWLCVTREGNPSGQTAVPSSSDGRPVESNNTVQGSTNSEIKENPTLSSHQSGLGSNEVTGASSRPKRARSTSPSAGIRSTKSTDRKSSGGTAQKEEKL